MITQITDARDDEPDRFTREIEATNHILFSKFDFSFVAKEDVESEHQLRVLSSSVLQLRFRLDRDSVELSIGAADAPRSWSDGGDEVVWWHDFYLLIGYENSLHPENFFKSPPRVSQGRVTIRDTLNGYAALLEAYLPRLMQPFSTNPPPGWWAGFDAYCAA